MEPFEKVEPEAVNYKFCAHCGDMFIAHHDLQQYCPEKNGRKDFCKYEQKKLVNESRLVERVKELSKTGFRIHDLNPLEKNEARLDVIMGSDSQKNVSSILMDEVGYEIPYFSSTVPIKGTTKFLVTVGRFTIELIDELGELYIFKISRL